MATYTQQAVSETLVFRKTNTHLGRHLSVTPANSTNRHLAYGRIILSGEVKSAAFYTADRETSLIVLAGEARVDVAGQQFDLTQYDGIYIPRDCSVHVRTDGNTDIAEFSADVSEHYPLQVVRYSVISQDPSLKFTAGAPIAERAAIVRRSSPLDYSHAMPAAARVIGRREPDDAAAHDEDVLHVRSQIAGGAVLSPEC